MKEYEVKHRYHLKKNTLIKKKKVRATYMDDGCQWKIYTYLVLGSEIS